MAWIETDHSKHTHFRWKIKWRLEHSGALGIMGETAHHVNYSADSFVRSVRRQSKSQAGNIMSAFSFRVDGRQSQPLHRSFVRSSLNQNSSRIFLTSLKGIGVSSRSPVCSLSLTQTLKERTEVRVDPISRGLYRRVIKIFNCEHVHSSKFEIERLSIRKSEMKIRTQCL